MREFLRVVGVYLFTASVFGIATTQLYRVTRRWVDDDIAVCAAFVAVGCVGYATFYLYFFSIGLGTGWSISLLLTLIASAVRYRDPVPTDLRTVLVVAGLFGLAYLGALYVWAPRNDPALPARLFFEQSRPHDWVIPLMFAEAVYDNLPTLHGPDQWGWFFSERPPLQTGFTLLFSPLWSAIQRRYVYQAIATILQTSGLVAVWLLCRGLGFERKLTMLIFVGLGGSAFVYYNSVYAWPKLLAATFCILAAVPLLRAYYSRSPLTTPAALTAAGAAALAMLSHGGAFYALAPLLLLLIPRLTHIVTLRAAAVGCLTAIALYAPWSIYTATVNPNNGRLLKLHLVGGDFESKEPLLRMLVHSYTQTPLWEWLEARRINMALLTGVASVDRTIKQVAAGVFDSRLQVELEDHAYYNLHPSKLRYDLRSLGSVLRMDQTEHLFRALAVLNVAWPLLLIALVRRRIDPPLGFLLCLCFVSILFWITLQFRPGGTTLTTAGYAAVVWLHIAAIAILYRVSPRVAWVIVGANIALTVVLWLFLLPGPFLGPTRPQPAPILALALAIAALTAILLRWSRSSDGRPHSSSLNGASMSGLRA